MEAKGYKLSDRADVGWNVLTDTKEIYWGIIFGNLANETLRLNEDSFAYYNLKLAESKKIAEEAAKKLQGETDKTAEVQSEVVVAEKPKEEAKNVIPPNINDFIRDIKDGKVNVDMVIGFEQKRVKELMDKREAEEKEIQSRKGK